MSAPDVSVIVISYNDSARLPRALLSIRRQTLRSIEIIVVDDASTDDTESIVRRIAADDPRVRYERLPENSGGCSAPRNRGVDLALAPWVMFCDSDDEYERHACKNLLQAAERLGADVVCGTVERVDVGTGRTRRWRPEVHEVEHVADGLAEFPDLLYDTISVNKIYRRDLLVGNGIRFPEGLLFEDQLFTLEAMAVATRVASIPETVYRWYVDRLSDEPSITQRRNEARNVESRIEVNRQIDAFLAERGLADLQEVKDLKFLRHDVYLYLSSMLEVDDETALTLMDRLVPYVSAANLRPAWQLRPALRVAIYHLLVHDLEGVRSAMRFVKWASVVDMPIAAEGGREYWGCEHLRAGPAVSGVEARDWLDVTDVHLLSIPFTQRRYLHRVDDLRMERGDVVASGSTVDYDGSLADVEGLELRLLVNGLRTAVSVPAGWTSHDGATWRWQARGRASDHLGRQLAESDRGTVALAMSRGPLVNVTSARSPESVDLRARIPFPGRSRRTGPDCVELSPYEHGAIGWRAIRVSPWRRRAASVKSSWFRIPGTTDLAKTIFVIERDWLPPLLRRVGSALPRRPLALLESDGGRTSSGNARAISEALHRDHPQVAQAWVYRTQPERVPPYAEPVRRMSLRHAWLIARGRYRIDDGTSPASGRKPRGAVWAFSGHGVPVHRIGLDDPSVLVSKAAIREVRRRSRTWDLMVSASRYDADVSSDALAYSGTVAESGLARMDDALAARGAGPAGVDRLRQRLDLPLDRPVVLYAPSPRDGDRQERAPLIDLDRWTRALGDRAYLLLRPHPSERFTVATRLRHAVREIADVDNLSEYLAGSDLFVSDYSSLIADAALADVPICLYQPDRAIYADRTRGLYPGLDAVGPLVTDMDELIAAVDAWLSDPHGWDRPHAEGRRAFAVDRCGPTDGRSAERAVSALLSREPGAS